MVFEAMATNRDTLFSRLAALGIATTTVQHDPVFTVEQSAALRASLPGAHTKNLFLTDKDGRMVLVVAKDDTKVDLKALARKLGAGRFSFGKAELLEAVLGVSPGAVTPLALISPSAAGVAVVIDQALMDLAEVNCHPLENTATTRLTREDLIRFIKACGHEPSILVLG
jgi:Ala-tRNA(Pro) deacylase